MLLVNIIIKLYYFLGQAQIADNVDIGDYVETPFNVNAFAIQLMKV